MFRLFVCVITALFHCGYISINLYLSWSSWHLWLMRVVILHPYTKVEVCRPCHSEDMAHGVCQLLWLYFSKYIFVFL